MSTEAKFYYFDRSNTKKEGVLALEDYSTAARMGLTVTGFLQRKYPDGHPDYGTVFRQGVQSLGIVMKTDIPKGLRATSIYELMTGDYAPQFAGESLSRGGMVVSPGAGSGNTPASRIFSPEIVLSLVAENLIEDYGVEQAAFNSMLAGTDSIPGQMFTQPMINVTAPRGELSQPIAQNSLPRTLVSITASQSSKTIVTNSIGLQISDQAAKTTTLDVIGTIMQQQTEGERIERLWESIDGIVNGNPDAGQAALTPVLGTAYDVACTGGIMTQEAWLKMLYDPTRKVSRDCIICTLPTLLALQSRTGRPVMFDPRTNVGNVGDSGSYGLNVEFNVINWAAASPRVLLVPDTVLDDYMLVMFDRRYGIRRAVDVSATYQAVENMVLQRSTYFRVDFGDLYYRFRDEAFTVVDFS